MVQPQKPDRNSPLKSRRCQSRSVPVDPTLDPSETTWSLRRLTTADLPFADSVRALAGWNQTVGDWERFLATESEGCFLAEWAGVPAGTATTTVYGPDLAWVGMVLVHPDYRRRGIGQALLRHSIAYLRSRDVRCIKLDATPAGKLVYDGLGFRSEWTLARWAGRPSPTAAGPRVCDSSFDTRHLAPGLRPWQTQDLASVRSLDQAAFGVSRDNLLPTLARQSRLALVLETKPGRIDGLGFVRAGSQALYLGPVVANSAEAGLVLLKALLAGNPGKLTFWDIPDLNEPAIALAQSLGFAVQRPLTRMFLGENVAPGDPSWQFALAGPEVG